MPEMRGFSIENKKTPEPNRFRGCEWRQIQHYNIKHLFQYIMRATLAPSMLIPALSRATCRAHDTHSIMSHSTYCAIAVKFIIYHPEVFVNTFLLFISFLASRIPQTRCPLSLFNPIAHIVPGCRNAPPRAADRQKPAIRSRCWCWDAPPAAWCAPQGYGRIPALHRWRGR